MEAYLLTEGGKNNGFGHLSRCIVLSQALTEANIKWHLITDIDQSASVFLKALNIEFIGINWKEQLPNITDATVFVDSYKADNSLYAKLKENNLVVAIDDYNRIDYKANVVICPTIYGDMIPFKKRKESSYLLGKDYIILREEFWSVPEKKINNNVKTVLVFLGGFNNREFMLSLLQLLQDNNLEVHLVVPNNLDVSFYIGKTKQLFLYNNLSGKEILDLMLYCDLAVSAGGQTTYELARVGIPTIGICVADNQLLNLEYLSRCKYLNYAGWYNQNNIFHIIMKNLNTLLDLKQRKEKNVNGRSIITGKGAKLIIKEITK